MKASKAIQEGSIPSQSAKTNCEISPNKEHYPTWDLHDRSIGFCYVNPGAIQELKCMYCERKFRIEYHEELH